MERGHLFSSIALATILAFSSGCENSPAPATPTKIAEATSTPPPLPTKTATPLPYPTQGAGDPNIEKYYPELEGLPLKERQTIVNQYGNRIEFYNFTNVELDLDAARQRFNYFGGFVSHPLLFESSIDGWPFYIEVSARPRNSSIPFFIIPERTPPPSTEGKPFFAYAATRITGGIAQATYVRVAPFNPLPDLEEAVNHAIAVEACQEMAKVEIKGVETPPAHINIVDLAIDAQENFCNVWGRYFSVKQMEILYNQVRVPNFPGIRSKLIIITESMYDFMPKIPKIARVR